MFGRRARTLVRRSTTEIDNDHICNCALHNNIKILVQDFLFSPRTHKIYHVKLFLYRDKLHLHYITHNMDFLLS